MSKHRISQQELWERSKYREEWPDLAGDRPCHLEGQAVRVADKISYLVSDLEDGIRLGVLTLGDLRRCQLFEHAPLDYKKMSDETDLDRYIAQRRALLAFLMEDVISATAKRLSRKGWQAAVDYVVDHSDTVREEVSEVWNRLQAGVLHRDARVISANLQAAKMVGSLFVLFAIQPALVEGSFARTHRALNATPYKAWYRKFGRKRRDEQGETTIVTIRDSLAQDLRLDSAIGVQRHIGKPREGEAQLGWDVRIDDLVMAKDYVASLTDARARRLYDELVAGVTPGR